MPVEHFRCEIGDVAGFDIARIIDEQGKIAVIAFNGGAKLCDAARRREVGMETECRAAQCGCDFGHACVINIDENKAVAARIKPLGDFGGNGPAAAGDEGFLHVTQPPRA